MRFERVTLGAPADGLPELLAFYRDALGLDGGDSTATAGETELEFAAGEGAPFYHFALLVPGDRFDAALEWARGETELLPSAGSGEVVFDFGFWDALACYFHDPAGNIVELIAHRGLGERGTTGPFAGGELLGLSELGLVGDQRALARSLEDELGVSVWDGDLDDPRGLAFAGEKARTLILAPPGRGWLPTGRPSERHALDVLLAGAGPGEAVLDGDLYRIRA
jgi:catechol 2,3-dioxygenase-like lactoylglutathione lyase family enzyme